MSNSSSDFPWGTIFVIGLIIVGIMWICDAGPFEKSYTPSSTYSPSYNSNGSNVSFGSSSAGTYTVNAYFWDGTYAAKVTVRGDKAYVNGSSQGANIYNAPYNAPGGCAHYCYWASSAIYF